MNLVRIADLVGQDVTGLKIDRRSRDYAGELQYQSTVDYRPEEYLTTLLKVEYRTEKALPSHRKEYGKAKVKWLYWTWVPTSYNSGVMADCGYSGILAEDTKHEEYFLQTFPE